MSILGIEFNDHAITGISDDRIVFAEPGAALLTSSGAVFGSEARKAARSQPSAYHDRYWRDLSEQRIARGSPEFETFADLAYAQLYKLWKSCGDGISSVVCAVPSYWSNEQLALLLGLGQEAGMPMAGLVTIPVAATRRHYPDYELIHIDLGAHATSLTQLSQKGGVVSVDNDETIMDLGTVALERTCAEYVARRFLDCSRFDPMHDAQSEQSIYDLLPTWLEGLTRGPETDLRFEYKANEFTARIRLVELEEWLQRRSQPLIQSLRAKLSADRPTALQVSAALAAFPGVAEALADLPGCDVFVLEPGAAARGLVQRQEHLRAAIGALSLSESLPVDQPPADVSLERAMASSSGGVPTHLVLGGQAYRLSEQPLRIGAESAAGEYAVLIATRYAGVSRRHCSVELNNGRAVLSDHSRYGTRLNGHKVEGSAVLQPGDVISLGDPACELQLITEVSAGAAGAGL